MKIFGICRYSVLIEKGSSWKVGRSQSWENYKSTILNTTRLRKRLNLFQNITLPSLAGQSLLPDPSYFQLCILTTDQMPIAEYGALLRVIMKYPWCKVVVVNNTTNDFNNKIKKTLKEFLSNEELFISFRIDDDDALGKLYLEKLIGFGKEEYYGSVISFPYGYTALYNSENNLYTHLLNSWQPKIAIGLAYIGRYNDKKNHILTLGNHMQLDNKHPLLTVPTDPMYIRTIHDDNDTYFEIKKEAEKKDKINKLINNLEQADLNKALSYFSLK